MNIEESDLRERRECWSMCRSFILRVKCCMFSIRWCWTVFQATWLLSNNHKFFRNIYMLWSVYKNLICSLYLFLFLFTYVVLKIEHDEQFDWMRLLGMALFVCIHVCFSTLRIDRGLFLYVPTRGCLLTLSAFSKVDTTVI